MSTPEILWLVHEETIAYMKEHEPRKVRKYLMDMDDDGALIAWDKEMMASKTKR